MNNYSRAFFFPLFLLISLSVSAQEFGLASYYSDRYHGRETAYGEVYDKTKLTCSHKKHPYGTLLKITRLDNKESVVCKVIDKGPYTKGRIVDLSKAAAEKIDLIKDGVAEVKVEVINRKQNAPPVVAQQPVPPSTDRTNLPQEQAAAGAPPKTVPKPPPAPSKTPPAGDAAPAALPQQEKTQEADPNKLVGQDYSRFGLYRIRVEHGPEAGYAVQVMVVSDYEKVIRAIASLQAQKFDDIFVSVEQGQNPDQTMYKLLLGKFDTESLAQNFQETLKTKHKITGFVVSLEEKKSAASTTGNN